MGLFSFAEGGWRKGEEWKEEGGGRGGWRGGRGAVETHELDHSSRKLWVAGDISVGRKSRGGWERGRRRGGDCLLGLALEGGGGRCRGCRGEGGG